MVNYDLPKTIDEYVHRIGRTGRVGNQGIAASLYDPEQDKELAADLLNCLVQVSVCQQIKRCLIVDIITFHFQSNISICVFC